MTMQKLSAEARAFIEAIRSGNTQAVAKWLEKGADPNTCEGSLPVLTIATFGAHLGIVRLLIAAGADLDAFDSSFATALHAAVGAQHFKIAQALLDAGADINAQRNPGYSSTPLHSAIYQDIMKDQGSERTAFLLYRGADVSRRAYIGIGKISETGDALAQALSMPDNKGAALAELIANWQSMGDRQRRLNAMVAKGRGKDNAKGKLKL